MDKLLILLVTLSWAFMATNAQDTMTSQASTTTMAPASATTVAPASATTAAPASATTAAPASATTAAPASATTATVAPASATTAAPASATTVAPASATTAAPASATTAAPASATTATVAPASATTATVAPASATTVAPASATTAAPASATNLAPASATNAAPASATNLAPASNATTVAPNTLLAVASISREECGSSKLCAAEPSECSPASGSCHFLSAKQQSGQNYNFELSGQSDGYIAAGVSSTASQTARHRAYVCAKYNGAVRFFTGFINNLVLNLTESLNSSNQQGSINSGKIQCTFSAVLPDTTTRAADYVLSISTGSYDPSSEVLGNANFRVLTPRVNLSDPATNITNLLGDNSTSSAYPVTHAQSFLPVLLVTVSMLAFTAA